MHLHLLKDLEWHSAAIDWCEENDQVSTFTVEFWNTVRCK